MLKSATFEHDGATYTLHPPTIFDHDMRGALLGDAARAWAQAHGLDSASDIPYVMDKLIVRYVDWLQITTIQGDAPFGSTPLYGVNGVNMAGFEAWVEAILADNQALAKKWAAAYAEVTAADDDPKNANGGSNSATASVTLPAAATD